MEIVRIGKASLSEQSWWRFGRELIGRHKAYQRASLIIIGGVVALQIGVAAAIGGGMAYAYMFTAGIQDWLKKRKFGKAYTIVTGLNQSEVDVKGLAKKLKNKLACGGTGKDGDVELQGNHLRNVRDELIKLGFPAETIRVNDR